MRRSHMVKKRRKDGPYEISFRRKGLGVLSVTTETMKLNEAKRIEANVKHVVDTGAWRDLDPISLRAAVRLFSNRNWKIPDEVLRPGGPRNVEPVQEELTLERASKIYLADPETREKSIRYRDRQKECIRNFFKYFGADTPFHEIRIKDIKDYMGARFDKGRAPDTVKREIGVLSKIYQVLVCNELCERNLARDVRWRVPKEKKRAKRRVSLSQADFKRMLKYLPDWYKPMAALSYYTGMRQREVRLLRWGQVDLPNRMIRLNPQDTKEGQEKRVPLCPQALATLREVLTSCVVGIDHVFLRDGKTIPRTQMRRFWESARNKAGLPDLRFHDLRHAWKSNVVASRVKPEIAMAITGHGGRGAGSYEGYGALSDAQLVNEVHRIRFDSTETIGLKKKIPDDGSDRD
jgi:integrase